MYDNKRISTYRNRQGGAPLVALGVAALLTLGAAAKHLYDKYSGSNQPAVAKHQIEYTLPGTTGNVTSTLGFDSANCDLEGKASVVGSELGENVTIDALCTPTANTTPSSTHQRGVVEVIGSKVGKGSKITGLYGTKPSDTPVVGSATFSPSFNLYNGNDGQASTGKDVPKVHGKKAKAIKGHVWIDGTQKNYDSRGKPGFVGVKSGHLELEDGTVADY